MLLGFTKYTSLFLVLWLVYTRQTRQKKTSGNAQYVPETPDNFQSGLADMVLLGADGFSLFYVK